MVTDLCQQLNLSLQPASLAKLSPVAKQLFAEVAFQFIGGDRKTYVHTFSGIKEKQNAKSSQRGLDAKKTQTVKLHLQGFEQGLGLSDQMLSEGLRPLLQPFLKDQECHIKYVQTGPGLLRHRIQADGSHELVLHPEAMMVGKHQARIEPLLHLIVLEFIQRTKESFSADFWEDWDARYAQFVKEVQCEFEQSLIERGLVRVLEDEMLRQALTGLLYQAAPSEVQRLSALAKMEEDEDLQSLWRDVRVYEEQLSEQLEKDLRTRCPALVPFLQDWKELVQLISTRTPHHSVDVVRLNAEWKRISQTEQVALRPSLVEYAQVVARVFPLPDWYRERADVYLK
jgi:hypothetical protein